MAQNRKIFTRFGFFFFLNGRKRGAGVTEKIILFFKYMHLYTGQTPTSHTECVAIMCIYTGKLNPP